MKYIILWGVLLFSANLVGQSTKDSSLLTKHFDFELKQLFLVKPNRDLVIDPVIQQAYQLKEDGRIYDNPFYHSALYADMMGSFGYKDKYFVEFHAIMEHRGMSLGVYNSNAIVAYPKIRFGLRDTLFLGQERIGVLLDYGDLQKFKLHQGLRIYNLDVQGMNVKIKWRNLYLKFNVIGDLSFGNSLELNELSSYSLGFERSDGERKIDYRLSLSLNGEQNSTYFLDLSSKYSIKNSSCYFQVSSRHDFILSTENLGLLFGYQYVVIKPRFNISVGAELRYYGEDFNTGYFTPWSKYSSNFRNPKKYLYPLKNYQYPFSKWAIFTDYGAQRVWGLSNQIALKYELSKKWKMDFNIETMSIARNSSKKIFTYIFYTERIYFEPIKTMSFGLTITNKIMNLERPYQTFFMGRYPFFGLSIQKLFQSN